MLGKLKDIITQEFYKLGILIGKKLSPNTLTFASMLIGVLSGFILSRIDCFSFSDNVYDPLFYGALLLIISGVFDGFDGLVARATNKVSKVGAFLDSISDRIVDACIFFGLGYGGYINWELSFLAVVFSQLISYARAKGESLGIRVQGVGLMERQERILFIFILLLITFYFRNLEYLNIGMLIYVALCIGTFLYRCIFIISKLQILGKTNKK